MMTESRARVEAPEHLAALPRDKKSIARQPTRCGRTPLATPAVPGQPARSGRIRRWLFRERLWRLELLRAYSCGFTFSWGKKNAERENKRWGVKEKGDNGH